MLREQAPHLAHLPVSPSPTSGSSNWVFRLGDDLAVRMPRTDGYTPDLHNEIRWLPHLAPRLPVPVPSIVAVCQPSNAFPRPWTVVTWLRGELPVTLDRVQQDRFARTFGTFVETLHAIDTDRASAGSEHWGYRCGEPVTDTIDEWADRAATALADLFDPAGVREAWRRLREVPPASRPACLVHTDLSSENLLTRPDGHLAGVLDFGGLGVGDRSVDFLYAWSVLDAPAREVLGSAAGADDATWVRARTWAFVGPGLLTIESYRQSMPARTTRLTTMVETLFGHVKGEWPHLEHIRDGVELEAELERVQDHYNHVRLSAAVGYVTPDDEHEGRGEGIRQARREGLTRARENRIEYRRTHKETQP